MPTSENERIVKEAEFDCDWHMELRRDDARCARLGRGLIGFQSKKMGFRNFPMLGSQLFDAPLCNPVCRTGRRNSSGPTGLHFVIDRIHGLWSIVACRYRALRSGLVPAVYRCALVHTSTVAGAFALEATMVTTAPWNR